MATEHKNLHQTNLSWYTWIETTINEIRMMGKSISFIFIAGVIAAYVAAMITTSIGIWKTALSFDFYIDFIGLSFQALLHEEKRELWSAALHSILGDQFSLMLVHAPVAMFVWWSLFTAAKKKTGALAGTKFIKGTKLVPEEIRLARLEKKIVAGELKARFFLGRIPVPVDSEVVHFLIIASSGGGKGVLLSKVMMKTVQMKNIKGIVHDIKPEWILSSYRPDRGDLIFNPLDRRSIRWTIWNDIHDIMDLKNFASWIVPHNPAAKEHFWDDSARGILEAILLFLWKNNECTNAAIRQMINLSGEELAEVLKGYPGAEYAAKKDSLSTLKTKMQWVDFLPDGDFSIKQWIEEAPSGLLFLSNTEKTQALFKPVLSLFVNAVGSIILNMPDDRNRRFYFFLDEFTALHRLDKVIDVLKLGRSKGASVWMALQDFQQLKKIYSEEDMRTIINNSKNIAVGQVKEPDAAKYLASRFGKQEFYENSKTRSMGVENNKDGLSLNEQRKEDFVVKDTDLLNLPERQFYVMINGYEGVTQTIADIQKIEKTAEGFLPLELSKDEQIRMIMAKEKSEFIEARFAKADKNKKTDDVILDDEDEISIDHDDSYF